MIEILATVLCVRNKRSLPSSPSAIRFQSMHVLVVLDDNHVNQQPDNRWQLYSTQLNSTRLSPRWHSPLQGVQLCLLAHSHTPSHTHTLTHCSTIHLEAGHVLQLQQQPPLTSFFPFNLPAFLCPGDAARIAFYR